MKDGKWVPWRVIAALIGVLAIVYMWSTKDVAAVYSTLPAGAVAPYIMTNMAVMLAKVGMMTAAIWLFRRGIEMINRKKEPR